MRVLVCCLFCVFVMNMPVFAAYNLDHKIIKFHEKRLNCDITGEYPQFYSSQISTNDLQILNTKIEKFIRSLFEKFLNGDDIGKSIKEDLKTDEDGDTFDITVEIVRADTKYVSVLFDTYFMPAGGPHGVLYYYAFNYDVEHARVVHLRDLFEPGTDYLKQMNYFSNIGLLRQLGKDFAPKNAFIESDQFTFDKKRLTIHYDVYEVASYSAGTPEIKIPFERLTGLKDQEFGRGGE